jgi:hypothetical protein
MGQENTPAASDTAVQTATVETTASTTDVVKPAAEHMIPKSRFDEVRLKGEAAEAKLKEIETQESIKKGDYEKVINDLKPEAERAKKQQEVIDQYLEVELAQIPEDKRSLIPEGDAVTRLAYITKNKAHLISKGTVAQPNTGAPLNPTTNADTTAPREFTQEQIADPKFYQENEGEILNWMSGGKRSRYARK